MLEFITSVTSIYGEQKVRWYARQNHHIMTQLFLSIKHIGVFISCGSISPFCLNLDLQLLEYNFLFKYIQILGNCKRV